MANWLTRGAITAGQDAYDAATSSTDSIAADAAYAAAWCGFCPSSSLPYTSPQHSTRHVATYASDATRDNRWQLHQILEAIYHD